RQCACVDAYAQQARVLRSGRGPGMLNAMKQTASVAGLLCCTALLASPLLGQSNGNCSPVTWTREQDHANMLQQLGIKALRPAPSGRAEVGAPNAANYDPTLANPYPDLPDPLTMKDGRK